MTPQFDNQLISKYESFQFDIFTQKKPNMRLNICNSKIISNKYQANINLLVKVTISQKLITHKNNSETRLSRKRGH